MAARELGADEVGQPNFTIPKAGTPNVFQLSSHARARSAIEFGLSVTDPGFNIFVLGDDRSGRMTASLEYFREALKDLPPPEDWVYLNNFRRPNQPHPYRLPTGQGRKLDDRMEALVPQLRESLTKAFGSEAYQKEIRQESEKAQGSIQPEIDALREQAQSYGLDLMQTEKGTFIVALGEDGKPLPIEQLPKEKQAEAELHGKEIAQLLQEIQRRAGQAQMEFADRLKDINRRIADEAVGGLIDSLAGEFGDHPELRQWFKELRADVLDHVKIFVPHEQREQGPAPDEDTPERRYAVNLFVDNSDMGRPRVLLESNPTYENLFGKIEYRPVGNSLTTDFTLLRSGALHRANGGILVLRAEALAANPVSWLFLKGALRDGEINMEELHRYGAMPIAGAPRPDPIPLNIKVVIVGSPRWYYTFFSVDPDFQSFFKVKADIDADMEATPENTATYVALIHKFLAREAVATCDDTAIARLLGIASRWSGDRSKLSARFEQVEDIVTEAVTLQKEGDCLTEEAISQAIANRRERNARVEDRMHESIADGTLMIDTSGEVVGQINALTVRDLGDHRFGAPSRVTARASIGRLGIVNIERQVALGGPLQQKGAMVLQGFLAGHFSRRFPLSFDASITFEQSYGGVEGDSASLAELLAVLSDLSGVALRQDLAITGSVNQLGRSQAIGGVTYKVEGFFRACQQAGPLTGTQGVVIPKANAEHVLLRQDVEQAVRDGKFHIWTVESIEDAVEVFTGIEAGARGAEGSYPKDSVYGRVMAQLEAFDQALRERHGAL